MNSRQNVLSNTETKRHLANAWRVSLLFGAIIVGVAFNITRSESAGLLWAVAPSVLALIVAIVFLMRQRLIAASSLLVSSAGLLAVLLPAVLGGLQPAYAVGAFALVGVIGLLTLPRKYGGRVLMAATNIAIASVLVDVFAPANRPLAAYPIVRWAISLVLLALAIIYFGRIFVALNIRTKIVIGILATGGVALGVFALFATQQTEQVTGLLSTRLENSVSRLAEEQLKNKVDSLASQTNGAFDDARKQVESLTHNWELLQLQQEKFGTGTYWDARTRLTQLDGGQYGNPSTDVSSVFVPTKVVLTDDLLAAINTSAYLDFYAPAILQANPSLLAVYAIDTAGVTRYYPNIKLATVVPPDFDARKRPYYQITSPLYDGKHITRWTIPYEDATGAGLVVTVASPVYVHNNFNGVVAADMQLSAITKQVETLKIGQTGYAFMLDDAGRIISMPPAGYQLFGLRPNDLDTEDFSKQTLLGQGGYELSVVVRRMVAGGNGLLTANVHGVPTYIAFSPISANGYSLGMVVPVSELQGAIIAARNEVRTQVEAGRQVTILLLVLMLVSAILVSLVLGRVIALPIIRLTEVANQIVAGDLNARSRINAEDEIGTLSSAFNTMTSRLSETLKELENRVEQRTAELASANEKNERRARQFESISQVAATISSTRDLNALLPQIAAAIAEKFGFYHAGIFLLDSRREYAVLSAANSEGGQRMLANGHRLRVGETGIVGYVTSTGKARVALNTGQDAVFFNNPFLPNTRSEIALPLKAGEEIIGALDVQSTTENAFGQEDINILTTLADQVSIAIQNARQFEETRKALAESTATARQFVQTGWQQFTKSQKIAGIRHTGARANILYSGDEENQNEVTVARNEFRNKNRGVSLSLPVKLRGEVIGTVDVRSVDNRKWDQDELDIATAILERAAIAMENARLLTESQKRAAKERTIGEISAKISAQSDIDQLLKTAIQELNRTLPGSEIAIQFTSQEERE